MSHSSKFLNFLTYELGLVLAKPTMSGNFKVLEEKNKQKNVSLSIKKNLGRQLDTNSS